MKHIFIFLILLSAANRLTAAVPLGVIAEAQKSTVLIYPAENDPKTGKPNGGGSGVLVSPDGYVITNFHVAEPCGVLMRCELSDGKSYKAVRIGLDPSGDLALIKLLEENKTFPYAEFADSDAVQIGDTVIVIGNPFMLAEDGQGLVSQGIISGIHRFQAGGGEEHFLEYTDCLQTDAAVNPGNSGGPLFNAEGKIIGIVGRCSFEKRGRVNVGIGFAVSSNQVRYFLGDLKSGRIVDHGNTNCVVATNKDGGVFFDDVLGTSDAYRSGLRSGDELLRFAGRTIDTANTFQNIQGIFPKGWRLPVTVRGKDGKRFETLVRLTGLHSEEELLGKRMPNMNAAPAKESIKHPLYEARSGFANYYFNGIETKRVLEKWRTENEKLETSWKFDSQQSAIKLQFSTLNAKPSTLEITDKGIRYELPFGSGFWEADLMLDGQRAGGVSPLGHYQSPQGSAGLFTALYLMRKIYVFDQNAKQNENDAVLEYTGTAPLRGNLNALHDVLTVNWRGNEVRFYFHPKDGVLAAIEMFGSTLENPCEVYFDGSEYEVRNGRNIYLQTKAGGQDLTSADTSSTGIKSRYPASNTIVKIYGAESGSTHGYQCGVCIAEGKILTCLTAALQTEYLRVVLSDGQRYDAKMTAADPVKELAVLQVSGAALTPVETYITGTDVGTGTPVYAVSNPFNIAQGNESLTMQKGMIAEKTALTARRGMFDTPYSGEIYVVDFTVNNPGACGGGVFAEDGKFIGIIGKELRNKQNDAWLNYVIPYDKEMVFPAGGKPNVPAVPHTLISEDTIQQFHHWGFLLIASVGERTPPFIDAVLPNSPADKAGLKPDDLIVMVNDVLTPSLSAVEQAIFDAPKDKPVKIMFEREYQLTAVTLGSR